MTILERILRTKREEVERAKRSRPLAEVQRRARDAAPPRDFAAAVSRGPAQPMRVIAEIKRMSPSAGEIVAPFDASRLARIYSQNGASAISVLTDHTYFGGRLDHLTQVRRHVEIPILRKDFTLEEYQMYESRAAGADAVLLIVEAIGIDRCVALQPLARDLGMGVIVEVHSEENLRATLASLGSPKGANYFLGINNRDLSAQKTTTSHALRLSSLLAGEASQWIAESGIKDRTDMVRAEQAGASAVLVGESLLRASDPGAKLRELMGL